MEWNEKLDIRCDEIEFDKNWIIMYVLSWFWNLVLGQYMKRLN